MHTHSPILAWPGLAGRQALQGACKLNTHSLLAFAVAWVQIASPTRASG